MSFILCGSEARAANHKMIDHANANSVSNLRHRRCQRPVLKARRGIATRVIVGEDHGRGPRPEREILGRQRARRPLNEVAVLLLAEGLGTPHRASPFRGHGQSTAILNALDAKHDENRIRSRTGEGVGDHSYRMISLEPARNASLIDAAT